MNVLPTRAWAAQEAARAFINAWGRRKRYYREGLSDCDYGAYVSVVPSRDAAEMSRRLVRAGRALAEECMRKRVRTFTSPAVEVSGAVVIRSKELALAMRVTPQFRADLKQEVWVFDVRGSRRAVPVCV